MCTADDTLRYVPLNSVHGYRPGDGQPRKCRDWSKIREYFGYGDDWMPEPQEAPKELDRAQFIHPALLIMDIHPFTG
ncbi:hypothetical protein DL767_007200 [Monosporascus sp. MG133]|nr:hypothetical protein DL767_007200 [Monosporascus sp. MG133]